VSFNPRYPASNFPNAVDEINVSPAELADAIMATQASLLPGGALQQGGTTNGTVAGPRLLGGIGVPATGLGAVGDYYFRSDTPGTANQRIYVKTAAAVWTALTV
jgi:hypothetical protein